MTGFEKWGKEPGNPTEALVGSIQGSPLPGFEIAAEVIPVSFSRASDLIEGLVLKTKPDIVLNLGLAPKRPIVNVERIAINLIDARKPDNDGAQPKDVPIDPGGPTAYLATLPTREILEELRGNKIPAALSYSAGTYLCNFVMYKTLRMIDIRGLSSIAGFIHVPYTPDLAVRRDEPAASMPMSLLRKTVEVSLRASAEKLTGERP